MTKEVIRTTISKEECNNQFSIDGLELPSGASTTLHFHESIKQVIYVTSGEATLALQRGDQRIEKNFKAGTAIYLPEKVAHQISNNSDTKLCVQEISTPKYNLSDDLEPSLLGNANVKTFGEPLTFKAKHYLDNAPFKNIKEGINGENVHEELFEVGQFAELEGFSLALALLPKGKNSHTEMHRHPKTGEKDAVNGNAYHETYVLLTGKGCMNIDGKSHDLMAGDAIYVKPGDWHQLENTGDEDLLVGVICGPKWCFDCMMFPEPKEPTTAPQV